MTHFAMLITHEQLVENCIAHRSVKILSRIYGTLCGPLKFQVGHRWAKTENTLRFTSNFLWLLISSTVRAIPLSWFVFLLCTGKHITFCRKFTSTALLRPF